MISKFQLINIASDLLNNLQDAIKEHFNRDVLYTLNLLDNDLATPDRLLPKPRGSDIGNIYEQLIYRYELWFTIYSWLVFKSNDLRPEQLQELINLPSIGTCLTLNTSLLLRIVIRKLSGDNDKNHTQSQQQEIETEVGAGIRESLPGEVLETERTTLEDIMNMQPDNLINLLKTISNDRTYTKGISDLLKDGSEQHWTKLPPSTPSWMGIPRRERPRCERPRINDKIFEQILYKILEFAGYYSYNLDKKSLFQYIATLERFSTDILDSKFNVVSLPSIQSNLPTDWFM